MYEYQFDAPKYFNFDKLDYRTDNVEVDFSNPNDRWFMVEHVELTPIKKNDSLIAKNKYNIKESKRNSIKLQDLKQNKKVKRKRQMSSKCIKRSKVSTIKSSKESIKSVKSSQQTGNDKKVNKILKNKKKPDQTTISQTKSDIVIGNCLEVKSFRVKRPCPYPLRIQRQWQKQSKRSWYSLSEASAGKAAKSMQKKINHRSRPARKIVKPFRF